MTSGRLLERLHDFKAHLWWVVRHFFRGQFTDDARDSFRESQGKLGKKSRVVGAAQFAQVPILNASQLVARWKLETPPALVSETQQLPIDGLGSGVYLIEATDGTYKAYTVAMVTSIAVVERTVNGQAALYVADRKTGAPVEKADVALWADGKNQSSGMHGRRRHGTTHDECARRSAGSGAGERMDLGAARSRCGAGDAVGLRLRAAESATRRWRISTRTGPSTGRGIRCTSRRWCGIKKDDTLQLPQGMDADCSGDRQQQQDGVSRRDIALSAHGTLAADLDLASDAALGYYSIQLLGQDTRE